MVNDSSSLIRIAVLSENPAYRAGLCAILEASGRAEIVAELSNYENMLHMMPETDVLVLAYSNVEQLLQLLDEEQSPVAAVLLITEDETQAKLITQTTRLAWGLLSPNASEEELVVAVESLNMGLVVGSPRLIGPLLNRRSKAGQPQPQESLSTRELQILQLLAQGLVNREIARRLEISEHTVKFHTSSIYGKLGVANRTEAVREGIASGLITL